MLNIEKNIRAADLASDLDRVFAVGAKSTRLVRDGWDPAAGAPVYTVGGTYATRGWTEWTQGFQYGNALYLFDALDDESFLDYGRRGTVEVMAPHLTHTGVHDHGFNNVSTYGNLLRLMAEGRIPHDAWERRFYRLALRVTGAVQVARWTDLPDGLGYVPSFNGAHSLFSDTIRSMRAPAVAHRLGHYLMGEQDARISLLGRLLRHAETTARYNVYFGRGRDRYDVPGRVVHESIFNVRSGAYRCPSTQQGYAPFSTWTRGHSWVVVGFAEQLAFLESCTDTEVADQQVSGVMTRREAIERFVSVARTTADFAIENSPTDGIPYWDTGAPGLAKMGDYLNRPAEPENDYEPVDASAAAMWAQGMIRLGRYLTSHGDPAGGGRYERAGLTIARTLFSDRYLATDEAHQGILLHVVYHHPNAWDHTPAGRRIPSGESCMWGDYHLLELAVLVKRLAENREPFTFLDGVDGGEYDE